ncbi:hypothetical protein [Polycyclovorans algicola]|uniref:hypothetical protein n=1 Tax=Polycyclovorans algicola TaxID=616992 RepID=UPI0004A73F20|nr:hypothetical protein [Polycyclovorans algicola]
MIIRNLLIALVLSMGLGVAACQKAEETPMEKATDAFGDATDTRDNEELKDAGEDAEDAMENAGDAVEEAVED